MSHASHDSDLATSLQAHLRGLCSISEVFAYLATSLNEDHEDIWEELVTDGGLDNSSGDSLPCFYVDWPDEGIMEQSTRMGIREDLFKPLDVALLSSETFDFCPFAFPATESDPDTSISLALYDYESLWWLAVWFLAAHVPAPLSTPAWSASVVPRIAISSDRAEEFRQRAYRQLFPTPGPSSASLAHVSRSIPLPAQRKEMLRSPRSPPPGRATTPPAGYTRMFAWQHAGYLQSVLYALSATKYFPNAANALVDAHVALRDVKSRDAAHPGNKWISREAAAALESAFTIVGERAAWLSDGKVMVARPAWGW